MTRGIRHQLDVYDTVLRLAYDAPTWAALRADFGDEVPDSIDEKAPIEDYGMVVDTRWEQNLSKRSAERRVQHLSIWINLDRHGPDLSELVATVAHECVHAAADILHRINERRTPAEAGEQFACLVDWLVRWVWDHLPVRDTR